LKQLHPIYIPGLGDQGDIKGQRWAVARWSRHGVDAEVFQMQWADNEPWESKFQRLLERIDELNNQGKTVALVGVSAGASAVINAFAARQDKIVGCVLIAGKVNRPQAIGQRYRDEDPSFITSAYDCEKALKTLDAEAKKRILSRFALIDETVYRPDSRIPGARNRLSPTISHVGTIAFQITLGAPSFIRWLKRL
jgi:predicted alpha/beta hydrolase family esterase